MSFITDIAPTAQKLGKQYNILPSLILAQACLESNFGQSGLALKGKNLFGIKGTYQGQCVKMSTQEYENGKPITIQAPFRKYPSWGDSLEDLCLLYAKNPRYHNIIGEKDINKAVTYPYQDGYCTDPHYASNLLSIVNQYHLTQYDTLPFPGILKVGSTGPNVKLIQNKLWVTPIDGIFGPKTEAAVKAFQSKHGLTVDGIVGPQTWSYLF